MTNDFKDEALKYAERGYACFSVSAKVKRTCNQEWF